MRFRKKTSRALKTLFFGAAKGVIDYRIARAERECEELVDRIEALKTMGKYAADAFGMVMNDEYFRPRPEPDSGETLH